MTIEQDQTVTDTYGVGEITPPFDWSDLELAEPHCLHLEDGNYLFPSADFDGTKPGRFLVYDPDGRFATPEILEDDTLLGLRELQDTELEAMDWTPEAFEGAYLLSFESGARALPVSMGNHPKPGAVFTENEDGDYLRLTPSSSPLSN